MGVAQVLLDLTTLKAHLGKAADGDADEDAFLTTIAVGVEAQIQAYIRRPLPDQTFMEVQHVRPNQRNFSLKGTPVTTFTDVRLDTNRVFAVGSIIAATSYHVELATGRVYFDLSLSSGRSVIQFNYDGGLASSIAAMVVAYPDLVLAARQQGAEVWRRRKSMGSSSTSRDQGATRTYTGQLALLTHVKELINPYRRRRIG